MRDGLQKKLTRFFLEMHSRPADCFNVYTEAFLNSVGHTRPFINYITFIFVILNKLPPYYAFLHGSHGVT